MSEPTGPVLRVVRGEPDAEELAALVAVLAARAAGAAGVAPEPSAAPSGWARRTDGLRGEHRPGPGAWRSSGRQAGARTRAGW